MTWRSTRGAWIEGGIGDLFMGLGIMVFKDPPAGAGGCGYIFPREREKDAFST